MRSPNQFEQEAKQKTGLSQSKRVNLNLYEAIRNMIPDSIGEYEELLQHHGFRSSQEWNKLVFLESAQLEKIGIKIGHLNIFEEAIQKARKKLNKIKTQKNQMKYQDPLANITTQRLQIIFNEVDMIKYEIEVILETLNKNLIGLEEPTKWAFIAMLCKENILLFGPPGTGKTTIAERIAAILHSNLGKFYILLNRFTTPDELFGPYSITQLKNGKLFRETKSYLPDASVVLLDEVFKSSSAVLNTLLRVLNERKFVNDGLEYCLPTQLVIGASNELPNEDMDALYDRFLIRHWIMPLEGKKLTDYINKVANGTINNNYQIKSLYYLNQQALAELYNDAMEEQLPDNQIQFIDLLINKLRGPTNSGTPFLISDRRIYKAINMIRVLNYIIKPTSFYNLILLKEVFCSTQDQRQVFTDVFHQLVDFTYKENWPQPDNRFWLSLEDRQFIDDILTSKLLKKQNQ